MRERSLQEQEYQVIALKYRAKAAGSQVLAELGVGSWLVFGLLQLPWFVVASTLASLLGAYSLIGVYNLTRLWLVARFEYKVFKQEFEEMLQGGSPNDTSN